MAYADWRPAEPVSPVRWLSEDEKRAVRAESLARRAEGLKKQFDLDVPEVELVRWTTYDEGPRVWTKCLQDAGFDVDYIEDGSIVWNTAPEESVAAHLVEYICIAEYTRDPSYPLEFSDQQLGVMYDFAVEWWVPCLRGQGLTTPTHPRHHTR